MLQDIEEWLSLSPLDGLSPNASFASSSGAPIMTLSSTASSPVMSPTSSSLAPTLPPPTEVGSSRDLELPETSTKLRARHLLLTWSQAPSAMSKEVIQNHLAMIAPIQRLSIGLETHEDGGMHFHAFVSWTDRLQVTPKRFILLGRTADVRIPKPRPTLAHSLHRMWHYTAKEDPNPLQMGDPPPSPKRKRDELMQEACKLALEDSVAAALSHLQEGSCHETITKWDSMSRGLHAYKTMRMASRIPARDPGTFRNAPAVGDDWRVLFLWGMSGAGKTQFARSLLPDATVVRHRNQLVMCDFSKGVIFDDFGVSHWPATTVVHLLDWDEGSGIDVKHGMVEIPRHTRKIFTYNNDPRSWMPPSASPEQITAIMRRIRVFEINNKLF